MNFCIPVSRKSGHPMTLQSSEFDDFLTEKAGRSSNSNMHLVEVWRRHHA
jgi:hypothetical protein